MMLSPNGSLSCWMDYIGFFFLWSRWVACVCVCFCVRSWVCVDDLKQNWGVHVPFSINQFNNLPAGETLIAITSGSRHSIASEIFKRNNYTGRTRKYIARDLLKERLDIFNPQVPALEVSASRWHCTITHCPQNILHSAVFASLFMHNKWSSWSVILFACCASDLSRV